MLNFLLYYNMNPTFIVIIILCFLLIILSISRNKKEYFNNNNIKIFSQNVPYDLYHDIPFEKNAAFGLCETTCNKYVAQEWRNLEEPHGWNPFGFWNGYWEQQKIKVKYIPKYRLLCGCNIEY